MIKSVAVLVTLCCGSLFAAQTDDVPVLEMWLFCKIGHGIPCPILQNSRKV